MTQDNPILQIDIISDPICPWCFIGKRKFDAALSLLRDVRINLIWRPFQLNPLTPAQGYDYQAQMARKFGEAGAKQLGARILEASATTQIKFDFSAIATIPNTLNAHRLIYWAAEYNVQHAIVENLFSAYFEHGQDIGAASTLLEIATACGMERNVIAERLVSDADCDYIRNADAKARDMGVAGVPAYILGNRFVIAGAQEPEALAQLIRKASVKFAAQS